MTGNGGRENHIRDVSLCELFGRIISAQTPECGNGRATACALGDAGTRVIIRLRAQRDTGEHASHRNPRSLRTMFIVHPGRSFQFVKTGIGKPAPPKTGSDRCRDFGRIVSGYRSGSSSP
jgi:hypothetical protein